MSTLGCWDGIAVWNSKASKKAPPCRYTSYGEARQCPTFTVLDSRTWKHKGWAHLTSRKFLRICGSLKCGRNLLHIKKFFWFRCGRLCAWVFFCISKLFGTTQSTSQGFLKVCNIINLKNWVVEWLKEISFEVERMHNVLLNKNDLMYKAPSAFYFGIIFWYSLQQRWSPIFSTIESPSSFEHYFADQTQ